MILDFPLEQSPYTEYCLNCHTSNQLHKEADGMHCDACGEVRERAVIVDSNLKWWLGDDNTYYHESAGAVLINPEGRILFFELTKFPFGFTVPAGHVDEGEDPATSVTREVEEEVGIAVTSAPRLVARTMIHGDSCRRGSDDHQWNLYVIDVTDEQAQAISVDAKEGKEPRWVAPSDVLSLDLAPAIKHLFETYADDIR